MKKIIMLILISFVVAGKVARDIGVYQTPAVVKIFNIVEGEEVGWGTGFIVDRDGIIVTNAHVITHADQIKIMTKNDDEHIVTGYYGINDAKDYAILKVNNKFDLSVKLADSDDAEVGDDVIAVGNPHGYLTHTLTKGIISAKRKKQGVEYFQTDATIAPGSSGGPLFNMDGEVIGITTFVWRDDRGALNENHNFALPINYVKKLLSYNLESELKPFDELAQKNKRERELISRNFWSSEAGKEAESYLFISCKEVMGQNPRYNQLTVQDLNNYCECEVNSIKTFIRDGNIEGASEQDWIDIDNHSYSCYKIK